MVQKSSDEQKEEIVERYQQGESGTSIAKDYGVHYSKIYNLLDEIGVKKRSPGVGGKKRKINEKQRKEICRKYKEGRTGPSLAEEYDISTFSVYNILNKRGVETRDISDIMVHALDKEELCRKYEEGMSTRELAKEYNIDKSTAYKILKRRSLKNKKME
ncbi:MAG: helix-turn-helix domain-containing protein [Thermoplasmatota archaeon]